MKLTATTVRSLTLPEGKDDAIFFDDTLPCFGLRLRRGGGRTWLVQVAIAGRTRRIKIGPLSVFDPGQAREEAKKILAEVHLGRDPVREKEQSKAALRNTFGACSEIYLERRRADPKLRPNSYREIERHFRNLKELHSVPLAQLDRRTISIEIEKLSAAGSVQANRALTSLRTFLNWACAAGYVESNVALHVNRNPERSRDRTLDIGELVKVWKALPPAGDDFGDIVRLLVLTGQRRSEISDLEWDEVDLDRASITLPPRRVKNGRQHVIPLSDAALEILRGRPRRNGRRLVFGRGEGPKGFSGFGAKTRLDKVVQLPAWTLHDLRRSAASGMQRLGVPVEVIERALNHTSGSFQGVAGIYQRDPMTGAVREALERWANCLLTAVEGREDTVVPLRRA
jgi:integrase